jgi:hypothetical protein
MRNELSVEPLPPQTKDGDQFVARERRAPSEPMDVGERVLRHRIR